MSKHALVFVHGMGAANAFGDYQTLFGLIRDAYDRLHQRAGLFDQRFELAPIAWKQVTEDAQRVLFQKAFGHDPRPMNAGVLIHPFDALRTFMTFFLGDVIAYVAEDDNGIRREVYKQLLPHVERCERYSLIAHSLGSVIAHDFAFHLFRNQKVFDPIGAKDPALIAMLTNRFHALFTFGSPVGLFMLQKPKLWDATPRFGAIEFPLARDRAWKNFWDRRDVVAYPLEGLYASSPANAGVPLKDVEVETGWVAVDSHLHYWKNVAMAASIAESLP